MNDTGKVIVCGAGAAGLAAAATLGRLGISVTVKHGPAYDDGFIAELRAGRIEIVAAVVGVDGNDLVLTDGTHLRPDAVIASTGYRRGLEGLVGHLGVLDDSGLPAVHGGRQHPSAPGLFFNGYRVDLSGQLRLMRFGARQIAGAVGRELAA